MLAVFRGSVAAWVSRVCGDLADGAVQVGLQLWDAVVFFAQQWGWVGIDFPGGCRCLPALQRRVGFALRFESCCHVLQLFGFGERFVWEVFPVAARGDDECSERYGRSRDGKK